MLVDVMLKYVYYIKGVVNMVNIDIADMYNNGKTLEQISKELKVSKRTIQRRLSDSGFKYNRSEKKYIKISDDIEKFEEKIQTSELLIVNRTYAIPQEIDIALKLKSALEGKTVTDILRDILQNGIEKKYFDIK
jgi:transcriptional regulator with XRE-family HTH domain